MMLAGVGMSLMSQAGRLSNDPAERSRVRGILWRRALFLFVVGLAYCSLWPADILHFYGVYISIAVVLLFASAAWLWFISVMVTLFFVIMISVLDYEAGWDWTTLSYHGFWTVSGFARNLFFNGFHPVFPWLAFLLIGVWLGRHDLRNPSTRRRFMLVGAAVALLAELISWLLVRYLTDTATVLAPDEMRALFGREPMPPMPFFMLQTGGTAVFVITCCVGLAERFPSAFWLQPFVFTGQLALTVYIAHVVLGLGALEAFDRLRNQTFVFSISAALGFCVLALACCTLCRQRFLRGPLEWFMRKITG